MLYEFNVYQMQVDDHVFWVAESKSLKGCVGQGDSADEAIKELSANEIEWINTAQEYKIPIPPVTVRKEKQFSGKVSLRFSSFVHEEANNNARDLGISLNQYINDAIVNYNAMCKAQSSLTLSQSTAISETSTTIIDISNRLTKRAPLSLSLNDMEEM
mgnify:CR=1 FL=1